MASKQDAKKQITVYRVRPITKDMSKECPDLGSLKEGQPFELIGELADHILVSVPITTPSGIMHTLHEQLVEQLKQPILLVTHNICFLRTDQLSGIEAAAVIKRIDEAQHAQEATGKDADQARKAVLDANHGRGGNGGGSRVSKDGPSGSEEDKRGDAGSGSQDGRD